MKRQLTELRKEWGPAVLALAIAVLLAVLFIRAVADAETRRFEAPLRALLGDRDFEALRRGEKNSLHYLGNTRKAPDFTLKDRYGRPWRLSDHRGKLVVMNFWSITCPPCIEELPGFEYLSQRMSGRKDIEIVSVSTDESWEQIRKNIPPISSLTVLFDPKKRVVRDTYGTKLYPETWFVDARGIIRLRVDGARDWSSDAPLAVIELFL